MADHVNNHLVFFIVGSPPQHTVRAAKFGQTFDAGLVPRSRFGGSWTKKGGGGGERRKRFPHSRRSSLLFCILSPRADQLRT